MTREFTAKKLVRFGSILLLFIVIVGYGLWRSRDLLFGIRMSVSGITDGMTTTTPLLALSGIARRANAVSVDGTNVELAQNGTWQDTIALEDGYNDITISAIDKFERTTTKEYRVDYTAPPESQAIPPIENPPPDTSPASGTPTTTSEKEAAASGTSVTNQ